MMSKYTNKERKGLPGGPNEIFSYTTGVFSQTPSWFSNGPNMFAQKGKEIIDYGSKEYKKAYDEGTVTSYSPTLDLHVAKNLDAATAKAQAPFWLKAKREFEKNNPKPVEATEGPRKALGIKSAALIEWENKQNEYIVEQIEKKRKLKGRDIEKLNELPIKEQQYLASSPKYQTSYYKDFVDGVKAVTPFLANNPISRIADDENLTNYEKKERLDRYLDKPVLSQLEAASGMLAPLSIPAKAVQSMYKDDYSIGDALSGTKNNAGLIEDIITDPLTYTGLGLGSKLNKVNKAVKTGNKASKAKSAFKSEINWEDWVKKHNPIYDAEDLAAIKQNAIEYNQIEEATKADGTWMKNPDGSKFKGTPEQFIQQKSSNFKKAFPYALKDESGEIKPLYHNNNASSKQFTYFDQNRSGELGTYYGRGQYSSADPNYAGTYGSNQYQLYGNVENPYTVDVMHTIGRSPDPIAKSFGYKTSDKIELTPEQLKYNEFVKTFNKYKNSSLEDIERDYKKLMSDLDKKDPNFYDKTAELVQEYLKIERTKLNGLNSLEEVKPINSYNSVIVNNVNDDIHPLEVVIPYERPMKSRLGNNGNFDMNNPNFYKALTVPVLGGSVLLNEYQEGSEINKNVLKKRQLSTEGYKRNSPDRFNPYNIIPSGNITMEDVDFPILGIDNYGNKKVMTPGGNYTFPGDTVLEFPIAQKGTETESYDYSKNLDFETMQQYVKDVGMPRAWSQFNNAEKAMYKKVMSQFNFKDQAVDAYNPNGVNAEIYTDAEGNKYMQSAPIADVNSEAIDVGVYIKEWNDSNEKRPEKKNLAADWDKKRDEYIVSRILEDNPNLLERDVEAMNKLSKNAQKFLATDPRFQQSYWQDMVDGMLAYGAPAMANGTQIYGSPVAMPMPSFDKQKDNPAQIRMDQIQSDPTKTDYEKEQLIRQYQAAPTLSALGEVATGAFTPSEIVLKAIQSSYKDDLTLNDALKGKKVSTNLEEDLIAEGLNELGTGLLSGGTSLLVKSLGKTAQNATQNAVQNSVRNTTQNAVQNATQNAVQNTAQNTAQNAASNIVRPTTTRAPITVRKRVPNTYRDVPKNEIVNPRPENLNIPLATDIQYDANGNLMRPHKTSNFFDVKKQKNKEGHLQIAVSGNYYNLDKNGNLMLDDLGQPYITDLGQIKLKKSKDDASKLEHYFPTLDQFKNKNYFDKDGNINYPYYLIAGIYDNRLSRRNLDPVLRNEIAKKSRLNAGQAFHILNENLDVANPHIKEVGSLSLDSFSNVLNMGRNKNWDMIPEGYIPYNGMEVFNRNVKDAGDIDINDELDIINSFIKDKGINRPAFINLNPKFDLDQILLPNYRLIRKYESGAETSKYDFNELAERLNNSYDPEYGWDYNVLSQDELKFYTDYYNKNKLPEYQSKGEFVPEWMMNSINPILPIKEAFKSVKKTMVDPIIESLHNEQYTVKPGDNLHKIANKYKMNVDDIIAANNLENPSLIKPNDKIRIPRMEPDVPNKTSNNNVYKVKSGDNLSTIAKANNTSVSEIVKLNEIKNKNVINIGQELKLPETKYTVIDDIKIKPKKYKDVDDIEKRRKEINSYTKEIKIHDGFNVVNDSIDSENFRTITMPDNERIAIEAQAIEKPNDYFMVVDKTSNMLRVYKGNNLVYETETILGEKRSDAMTNAVAKDTDGDGIITNADKINGKFDTDWSLGNKSTGAGVFQISSVNKTSEYDGAPSINLANERGKDISTSIHLGTPWRESKLGNKFIGDNRMSNGCVNCTRDALEVLSTMNFPKGTKVYVLPEEQGNRYEYVDGQVVMRTSAKNRKKALSYDKVIKDEDGNEKVVTVENKRGIAYNQKTLKYEPIKAEFDEEKFKNEVFTYFDFNDEEEYENTTKPFIEALVKNKKDIMKAAQIPSDVYNQIAKMTFGIYGAESNFGDTHSMVGNLGRATTKFFNSDSSSPDVVSKYNTYGAVEDWRSVGYTQMRWSFLNDREKEALKSLGITSNKDLLDPKKSAIATATVLGIRYNEQLTSDQKEDLWNNLPNKWNKRTNYSDRVKRNSEYLKLYQKSRLQRGGEVKSFKYQQPFIGTTYILPYDMF